MKNSVILLTLFMALMLSSFSCSKESDPVDEGLITLDQLNGQWNFVSYNYNGTEYNCSTPNQPVGINKVFTTLIFNSSQKKVTRINVCYTHTLDFDFKKNGNVIRFYDFGFYDDVDIKYTFTVLSYSGNQLKLRVDYTPSYYGYLGGTLTLVKQ